MTAETELRINRRNTAAFIEINPTSLILKPQRRVRSATGGFTIAADVLRPAQDFRIIDTSSGYIPNFPPQRTIDGIERALEFVLLATYDAQLAEFDTWTDSAGVRWEITMMFPDNGYERRALVVRYGD